MVKGGSLFKTEFGLLICFPKKVEGWLFEGLMGTFRGKARILWCCGVKATLWLTGEGAKS